jgi:hypothetical protein
MPCGAASMKTRPETLSSPEAERSIRPATSSEAIGSARSKPGQDDHGRDRGGDERIEVGEDLLEAHLDVEALAVGSREGPGRGDVDRDAGEGDRQDQAGEDLRRRDQPPDCLINDQPRQHQQQ